MKKRIGMFLAAAMAAVCAQADTWTDPDTGYTWTYRINGDTAEIYNNLSSAISPSPTGAVIIPSTLGGKPVTSIGDFAFEICRGITSVTIPDSVTSIHQAAFYGCRGLAGELTIPNSVTNIGHLAFYGCSGLTIVTIPDSVTSIANYAFNDCSGLMSFVVSEGNPEYASANNILMRKDGATLIAGVNGDVTIPNSVTSIGYYAFSGRSELTSVTIPDSVTSIGEGAFLGCSRLMSFVVSEDNPQYASVNDLLISKDGTTLIEGVNGDVAIPNSVTSIRDSAFRHRYGLTNVTIPDSVTSIGWHAFEECTFLKSITVPDSVTNIGMGAFVNCASLMHAEVPDYVENLGDLAFAGCWGLLEDGFVVKGRTLFSYYGSSSTKEVVVPEGVKRISARAFENYGGNLEHVTLPEGLTSIGDSAFSACGNLTSVTIPDSVTSIESYAFEGCSGLTSVTIPDSVTSIGPNAFRDCSGLTAVYITDLAKWCGIAFGNSYANPLSCAHNLYLNDEKITALMIPNGVTMVANYAFSGCSGLASVTIPDSVTSIGYYAFYNCSGLTSVTIPDSVTSIGAYAFSGCSGLASVTIPDSVTSIGYYAFYNCSDLTSVYVSHGDGDRIKGLMIGSRFDVSGVSFIEHSVALQIVFDANGGSGMMAAQTFTNGVEQSLAANRFIYEGHTFDGWATNANGSVVYADGQSIAVSSDMTLYAHWTATQQPDPEPQPEPQPEPEPLPEPIVTCTVTFDANGGTGGGEIVVESGVAVGELPVAEMDGHTFDGWFTLDGDMASPDTVITTSQTFVAHWVVNQYLITFNANGGAGGWSRTMDYGAAIVAPTVTQDGYVFKGWSPSVATTVPVGGATYTAQWDKIVVPEPDPEPEPEPEPDPVVVPELHNDDGAIESPAPTSAASEYNGYLVDKGGVFAGTIQVKLGKPNKAGLAAASATVQIGAGKKKTFKATDKGKVVIAKDGPTRIVFAGAENFIVFVGYEGMSGSYGAYDIDGSRNLPASKDKSEANAAGKEIAKWVGALAVRWNGGTASVTIDKKGKAKVSIVLSSGAKGTATTQVLIGDEWHCIPVMVTKKMNISFTLWLSADGSEALVSGLGDDVIVGKTGNLKSGAKFHVDVEDGLWAKVSPDLLTEHLPNEVSVAQKGTKFTLPKAGKLTMKKGVLDTSKAGENPSGLKLTLKKDGTFTGSFKVYYIANGKLKTVTANITGIVINGVGYGTATVKKINGSVPVSIE